MLVLGRHVGDRIIIGEGPGAVTLTVTEIRGDKVKLGFEARRGIPIDRAEVRERPSYTREGGAA